jgi:hypothetical protein
MNQSVPILTCSPGAIKQAERDDGFLAVSTALRGQSRQTLARWNS